MSGNLAMKLRVGTQHAHTAAENVGFTKCFVQGVIDRNSFAKFLSNLYFVYSELEAGLEHHRHHPLIGRIYFSQLNRRANLEKDLAFYYGQNWRSQIIPSPATQQYVARIRDLVANEPVLLIAHAYTRYMGDLSGGQMFQKIAQEKFQLHGFEGTSFYDFASIPDKQAFKNTYRDALNYLEIEDAVCDRIVAEANIAFAFNARMAQDLDNVIIQAIGQEAFANIMRIQRPGSTQVAHSK